MEKLLFVLVSLALAFVAFVVGVITGHKEADAANALERQKQRAAEIEKEREWLERKRRRSGLTEDE